MKVIRYTCCLIIYILITNLNLQAQHILIDETTALIPQNISVGQINQDSIPDAIYTSAYGTNITWIESPGIEAASYIAHNIVIDTLITNAVYIADIDQDNDGDLVCINYYNALNELVWLENIDADANNWILHACGSALETPKIIGVTDIDSDGDLDIIETEAYGGSIIWRENDADESFALTHSILETYGYLFDITYGDFDTDLDIDLALLGELTEITILINTDGLFSVDTIIDTYSNMTKITHGDLDNNGTIDLLLCGENSFAYPSLICLSAPVVTNWNTILEIDSETGDYKQSELADMDLDGDLDILRWQQDIFENSTLSYLQNNADGTDFSNSFLIDSIPGSGMAFFPTDLNDDTLVDIICLYQNNIWKYTCYNLFPEFLPPVALVPEPIIWKALTHIDIDGDYDNDLAMQDALGRVFWYNYDSTTESFSGRIPLIETITSNPEYSMYLQFMDINADGLSDLVLNYEIDGTYYTVWHKNFGGGLFGSATEINQYRVKKIWLEDIDIDGDKDIICSNFDELIWQLNVDGTGFFGVPHTIDISYFKAFDLFDYDEDGDKDILGYDVGADLDWGTAVIRNESGMFTTQVYLAFAGGAPVMMAPLDFDDDGDEDVLSVSNSYDPAIKNIYFNKHTGTSFTTTGGIEYGNIAGHPGSYKLQLLNADTLPDLVQTNQYTAYGYYAPSTHFAINTGLGFTDSWSFNSNYGIFAHFNFTSVIDYAGFNSHQVYWIKDALPEYPGFIFSTLENTVSEDGLTDTLTLQVASIPTDTLKIEVDPGSHLDIGAGPGIAMVIIFNPDSSALSPQLFEISTPDDAIIEGYQIDNIQSHYISGADVFSTHFEASADFHVLDNDNPAGIDYTYSRDETKEGQTGNLTIKLKTLPTEVVYVTMTTDTQVAFITSPEIDTWFNNTLECFTPKVYSIKAEQDTYPEGDHFGFVYFECFSEDASYDTISITPLPIFIIDNDFVPISDNTFSSGITICPNPVTQYLSVQYSAAETSNAGDAVFDIYSYDSRLVQHSKLSQSGIIDLNNLLPGSYLLRVSFSDGKSHVASFVKQNI